MPPCHIKTMLVSLKNTPWPQQTRKMIVWASLWHINATRMRLVNTPWLWWMIKVTVWVSPWHIKMTSSYLEKPPQRQFPKTAALFGPHVWNQHQFVQKWTPAHLSKPLSPIQPLSSWINNKSLHTMMAWNCELWKHFNWIKHPVLTNNAKPYW